MEYIFRLAADSDISKIMVIIDQAKQQMRREGKDQWNEFYPTKEHIFNDIHTHQGYVLCLKEKIIAYVAIVFSGEPAYNSIEGNWLSDQPYATLHRLAVANEMKRKGIATGLLKRVEILAKVKDFASIRIDTNDDNESMQRIIQKSGYSYCGVIHYIRGSRLAYEKVFRG